MWNALGRALVAVEAGKKLSIVKIASLAKLLFFLIVESLICVLYLLLRIKSCVPCKCVLYRGHGSV